MRDRPLIILGLLAFLAVVTVPIWYNLATGAPRTAPRLARPAQAQACVAGREFMRTSHMDLLLDWRADAVRRQDRTHVSLDGRTYTKSLTGTCLACHASKADFCDRCHAYAGVTPTCWACHLDGPGGRAAARAAPAVARRGAP